MSQFFFANGYLYHFDEGTVVTYHPWFSGFECTVNVNGEELPWVPGIQLLNPDGTPFADYLPEGMSSQAVAKDAAALNAYLETLPMNYRRLAGHFPASYQWLALESLRNNPNFASFVEQELNALGLGYIISAWVFSDAHFKDAKTREYLSNVMMQLNRVHLLKAATEAPFNKTYFKLLSRLPVSEFNGETLETARWISLEERLLKALIEGPNELSFDLIDLAASLPKWLQHAWLLRFIDRHYTRPYNREIMFPRTFLHAPPDLHGKIVQSLKHYCDAVTVIGAVLAPMINRWVFELDIDNPFPTPPIPGNEILQPILTPQALLKESQEMKNCVLDYYESIKSGQNYFYKWLGDERATVQLSLDDKGAGWKLVQHLGCKNHDLDQLTIRAIRDVVYSQLPKKPRSFKTNIAGLAYYQAEKVRGQLCVGAPLLLRREPGNLYDRRAIEVLTDEGIKLGYIPQLRNKRLSRLMDEGETLMARIDDPREERPYDIFIEVAMPLQERLEDRAA